MRSAPVLLFAACVAFADAAPAQQPVDRCQPERQAAFGARPCAEQRNRDASVRARLRVLLRAADDRQAAGHAENRQRCEGALQIAALCGTSGESISCGENGFRPAPPDAGGVRVRHRVDNGRRVQMQRCALQATHGGR